MFWLKQEKEALSNFKMQEQGCQNSVPLRAKAALPSAQDWHLTVGLILKQPSGLSAAFQRDPTAPP